MNPTYQHAAYGSDLYLESLAVRETMLRRPLGMHNRQEDIEKDHEQLHFVAVHQGHVIATVSAIRLGNARLKLRQMAVSAQYHGQGIGASLLEYAHAYAREEGVEHITLNARDSAIRFYEKLGYRPVGELFDEIGLTHQRMDLIL